MWFIKLIVNHTKGVVFVNEELEFEDNIEIEDDIELEFDLDEVSISDSDDIAVTLEEDTLPKVYLYLEGLVMLDQVKGLIDEPGDLVVVDAYADKNGVPTKVGTIELTSENVLAMQYLGLKVSLIREGKEPILFDQAEHFVQIIKTLKKSDTEEIVIEDLTLAEVI